MNWCLECQQWQVLRKHTFISLFLSRIAEIIVLPSYRVSSMIVKRPTRKIGSQVVRQMLSLNFSKFRDKLRMKCQLTQATLVDDFNEAYTSCICGSCGSWNHHLGASKVFHCLNCKVAEGRDGGAARKIFLLYIQYVQTTSV